SSKLLPSGATLTASPTAVTFGVSDVLNTFDRSTRGRLHEMLVALGSGLTGRGRQLGDAIHIASGAEPGFQQLVGAILAPRGAAQRLVPALESAVRPLAAARVPITDTFPPASAVLQHFVDQRAATQSTLDEAPSTLGSVQSGLSRGEVLLSATRSLASAVSETLPPAPAGLRTIGQLLRGSRVPLRRATVLLQALKPAVPAALQVTGALAPVLPLARHLFNRVSPVLSTLAPYGCDIINTGAVLRSMTAFGVSGDTTGTGQP